MRSAALFREKAAECRRLAAATTDDHDAAALSAMADEFEALAAEYAAHEDGETSA